MYLRVGLAHFFQPVPAAVLVKMLHDLLMNNSQLNTGTGHMKLLETYRGAAIYQKGELDSSQYQIINLKLSAKGRMPKPDNLIIHFDAEAPSQDEALTKIKADIDAYLFHHQLKRLKPEPMVE